MAEVILAKTAGFCFGVKRAVDTVYEQIKSGDIIYTYGPIIHNQEVVNDLSKHGVKVINSVDEIDAINNGTIIIRSHGISKEIQERIEKSELNIVDATCPFVKKIHNVVMNESKKGRKVVIIGSDSHPEVVGIKGWCAPDNPATVIETSSEAEQFECPLNQEICIVSQTTFNQNKFQEGDKERIMEKIEEEIRQNKLIGYKLLEILYKKEKINQQTYFNLINEKEKFLNEKE